MPEQKSAASPTPVESANLILKLYELRREETLRKARDFMVTFQADNADDWMAGFVGPHSAYIRMVLGYWDMAASLVLNGAVDATMFAESTGEYLVVFSKIEPLLPELRERLQNPSFLQHLQRFCLSLPDARARLDATRERMARMLAARAAAQKA